MEKYTTERMESIVCSIFNRTYENSTAFQRALRFVKAHDENHYRELLWTEIHEMGWEDELDEEEEDDDE